MQFKKSLLALALGLAAFGASAQTTGNINVSANVTAACTISVNPLAFGSYNSLSATALQQNTTLAITCSQGSVASIALGAGNNLTGAQRRMSNGAAGFLNYAVYQPASNAASAACAYTTSWGNGGAFGAALVTVSAPDLNARTYNVCGEIAAGQNAPVASYSDVVVATVTF
jgi:spore coat protein U-like protein